MKKLAVCVIAYNEEKNVGNLIQEIIDEKIENLSLFLYNDCSSDNTLEILERYRSMYPKLITLIKGRSKLGKNHAFNILLPRIKDYEISLFIDADTIIKPNSIKALYDCLLSNDNLIAISPLFIPFTVGLGKFQKTIASLHQKARIHIAINKKYLYLSGRMYILYTKYLTRIPTGSLHEDYYINLNINGDLIGFCKESIAYYRRPSSLFDLIRYYVRLGKAQSSIKKLSKKLWEEKEKRYPLKAYAFSDYTSYKFREFFLSLTLYEKAVFIFDRFLAVLGMYFGFYTYSPRQTSWSPIDSTKINYSKK
jgi:glycosyltransferase involved in cell wall biosynthesis